MFRFTGSCCLLWLITSLQLIAQSAQIHYLSGTDRENPAQWDFHIDKGRKSGSWQKINVPSCWEMEGFGEYNFGNLPSDERAIYKHQFIALPTWQGKHINLVFEGVLTDAEVKLNGQSIGAHRGGYMRFSLDVSAVLKYGTSNELEVAVNKRSNEPSNISVPMWLFGGIYKPVYLEVLPEKHITDITVETQANGFLHAQVAVNQSENLQITSYLQDLQGNQAGNPIQSNNRKTFANNKSGFEISTTYAGIQPWSAESPQRYRLIVELQDMQGKLSHRTSTHIGFRSVALKTDGLYINEKKLKLQGVHYRGIWHESGISVSKQISELDGLLLKEMNANAISASFYRPDSHLLDVCDSLGLYVVYDVADASAATALQQDINHPSVILLTGNTLAQAIASSRNRPVINSSNLPGLPATTMRAISDEIFIKTWQSVTNSAQIGLFLPFFADEAFRDGGTLSVSNPSTADKGVVDAYRGRSNIFHAISEWWSPVQLKTDNADERFQGTLTATNRFAFTNLNRCKFTWQLADIPNPIGGSGSMQIAANGTAFAPNIAPGITDKLPLNLPADWQERDLLIVTAFAPTGNEIHTWHFPIATQERHIPQLLLGEFSETNVTRKTNSGWELSGGDITVQIHPSGYLAAIKTQNKSLKISGLPISSPPVSTDDSRPGSITFRFPDASPLQTVSYALSDAGVLRIQYTGREIAFLCTESLQEIRVFAAGPLPQGQSKGVPLGFYQQKHPQREGDYRQFYWAQLLIADAPLHLMSASGNITMRLLPDGQIVFIDNAASAPGKTTPSVAKTLFMKTDD